MTELVPRNHLAPALLEVEVTESGLMRDPVQAAYALQGLRVLSVATSMDDVGSGQASLGYLKVLPVDSLKIDRSLGVGVAEQSEDREIEGCAVDLTHRLGMQAIAEGVEAEDCRRTLAGLGCDVGQGYGLGRPAAPEDCWPAPFN